MKRTIASPGEATDLANAFTISQLPTSYIVTALVVAVVLFVATFFDGKQECNQALASSYKTIDRLVEKQSQQPVQASYLQANAAPKSASLK
jgi:hypothetical protein